MLTGRFSWLPLLHPCLFFCPLLGFIRFLTNKERNDLLVSQARADAQPEGFQVTGTQVVGRTGGNTKEQFQKLGTSAYLPR